jgi:iron complex outermembrane receptor protein
MWGLDAVCGPRGLAPTRTNPTAGSNPLPGLAGVNVDGDPSNDRPVFGNQFISDKDVSFATGSNFSKIDASGLSVTANMDVAEGLALKSISAFRRLSADFGTDLDGSPIDIGDTSFSTNQRQYSQELQLIGSSFQKRLDWVLGAYYFHEKGDLTDFVPFGEGLVQVDGENLFKNIAYAAFTNLTYSVTDAFAVSFGLRFTDEHKDFEGRQRDLNSLPFKMGFPAQAFPDPSDVTRIYPIGTQRREFDDFTTRVALEYSLTDDIFSYASFSQGTKSGGFTTRLLVPEPMPNVAPDFDTEKADSYEIGLKTQLFGRRLQANLAAFYTQYDDIQVTVQRNISPTFENAGEGVIRGIELEFQSLVTDRLRLDGGLGILDAEYSDLEPETVLDRSDRFVNTPDFSANLNGSYAIPIDLEGGPLALDGELTVQADYTHKSNIANDAENNPFFFTDHVNVVNASLTWAPNAPTRIGSWELTLGVRNLTDTRYVVSGFENPGIGFTFANFSRPREWYLSVRFRR